MHKRSPVPIIPLFQTSFCFITINSSSLDTYSAHIAQFSFPSRILLNLGQRNLFKFCFDVVSRKLKFRDRKYFFLTSLMSIFDTKVPNLSINAVPDTFTKKITKQFKLTKMIVQMIDLRYYTFECALQVPFEKALLQHDFPKRSDILYWGDEAPLQVLGFQK